MKLRLLLISLLFAAFACVPALADDVYVQKGKTGIPEIDTLPVNEWDVPTEHNSLLYTMLFSIFPGGGQYYTGHYVRGGFITGIEGLLVYEVFFNKSWQRDRIYEQARPLQDSVAYFSRLLATAPNRDSIKSYQEQRMDYVNRVRALSDKKMEQEDLRKAEIAWLYGLHLYGMFDAFGIWYNNHYRSVEQRSMKKALLLAIIPGFGQMYNGEFGKAGLLYMSIIGASTSIWTSQNMVEYYLGRKHFMEREDVEPEDYDKIVERVTYYRKNRNQYIWAMALLYLYSMGDAVVDALLSDFDNPIHLALLPNLGTGGVQALFTFDF
jgi:TM2 domain-containing membrane protein YozV